MAIASLRVRARITFHLLDADPSRPASLLLLDVALGLCLRRRASPAGRLDAQKMGSYSCANP